MTTVTPHQQVAPPTEAQKPKTTGRTDAAWMIALLVVFAVAVAYFFANVIQFHLLPH